MAKHTANSNDIESFRTEAEYFENLVDQCISSYETLLSDVLSLDYVGVQGKYRSLVLTSPRYKKSTQMISAKNHYEAHKEVTTLIQELKKTQRDASPDFDIRNPTSSSSSTDTKDFKEYITLHSKLLDMKNDLYEQGNKKTSETELEALNVFFVPVTKEEFASLQNVEIYEGDSSGLSGFSSDDTGSTSVIDILSSSPSIVTLPDGTEMEVVE